MSCTYPYEPAPGQTDTSAAAADAIAPISGRIKRLVFLAVLEASGRGLTAEEAANLLGFDRGSVQPRLSELRRLGLVSDSGGRRPNRNGKRTIVWIAGASVEGGLAELEAANDG